MKNKNINNISNKKILMNKKSKENFAFRNALYSFLDIVNHF